MSIVLPLGRQSARLRRLVARRPWLRWIPIATCCIGFTAAVVDHRDDVGRARSAWGESVEVWIADSDLAPGSAISARPARAPRAIVPVAVVRADPVGATARQHVGAGEIITTADLAGGSPPGALMPDGWLAVPVEEATPAGADVGDRVRLAADGVSIADDAIVVEFVGDVPLVAVPADVAPLVALANESGVTLLRSP